MLCRGLKIKTTPSHGTLEVPRLSKDTVRSADVPVVPSENWQSGPENSARGSAWLDKVYKHNRAGTFEKFAAHRDIGRAFQSTISLRSENHY